MEKLKAYKIAIVVLAGIIIGFIIGMNYAANFVSKVVWATLEESGIAELQRDNIKLLVQNCLMRQGL